MEISNNSILSKATKTNFTGVYTKKTKLGEAVIIRYTINKKTHTRIVGYIEEGWTALKAFKEKEKIQQGTRIYEAEQEAKNTLDFINNKVTVIFKEFMDFREPFLAKNTIDNYKSIYKQYILKDFENQDIREITYIELQRYINSLLGKRRPATVEKIVSALKKFYQYLQDNGIYKYNPAKQVQMPKYDNKKYFTITKENVAKIVAYINTIENKKIKTIYLFLLQGRRVNEVLTLEWQHVDFASKLYHINYSKSKNRKNQFFYLEPFQIKHLKELKELNTDSKKYVFSSKGKNDNDTYLTYTTLFKHHNKLRKAVNMPDLNLHALRHMVAFLLINDGYSLEVTAKVLAHSNVSSTQRYAVLEMNKARDAFRDISNKYYSF